MRRRGVGEARGADEARGRAHRSCRTNAHEPTDAAREQAIAHFWVNFFTTLRFVITAG